MDVELCVSRCVCALRRECSFEHETIDDATARPLGDFQPLVATASQGRVAPASIQYINSIEIQDFIPPSGIVGRSGERSPRETACRRKQGCAFLISVHAATYPPHLDFGRCPVDGEGRAAFPSNLRKPERERDGPVGGAAASPIHRTAANQLRRADASQSATRNAARAVHQLERERMSR